MALSLICNTADLNQLDRTVVEIDGKNRTLFIKLRWHKKISRWMMSVFDEANNPVLRNIPIVGGFDYPSADLLYQFYYLGIGHAASFPFEDDPSTENPSYNNLGFGKEWGLGWGLPDE